MRSPAITTQPKATSGESRGTAIGAPETLTESRLSQLFSTSDADFQDDMLQGVSRTFALTIPQLPPKLRHIVSNAYLLCRIVDTIEDEPEIEAKQKQELCKRFINLVGEKDNAEDFKNTLAPLLSKNTIPAEHELIKHLPRVIAITHAFDEDQQKALKRCIRIMADGMAYFQNHTTGEGLENLEEMDRYCYFVAGVVGEMLTDLFAIYSPEMKAKHTEMMDLAVSFGQGLQMTNILKDIWEDQERSACWLPKDIFEKEGFDLGNMNGTSNDNFQKGLEKLIAVAHAHLENAFKYTLLIPAKEAGIRKFCLWALGMAILTLKKINHNKGFTDSGEVKISRKSVKRTIIATHLTAKSDLMLKLLFNLSRKGLPRTSL
ncbi:MAG: phytoene/squalene synthase family protein [Bacteroidota bacterium]